MSQNTSKMKRSISVEMTKEKWFSFKMNGFIFLAIKSGGFKIGRINVVSG